MITGSRSLKDLDSLVRAYHSDFDFIHAASSFVKAAKLVQAGGGAPGDAKPTLDLLSACFKEQAHKSGAQGFANVVWACGKLGYADAELLNTCISGLSAVMDDAAGVDLANTLYGIALLHRQGYHTCSDATQLLLSAVFRKLDDANAQDYANTLWAAAVLRLPLTAGQAQQMVWGMCSRLEGTSPQSIANLLWAVASLWLSLSNEEGWQLVSAYVRVLGRSTPQDVSIVLWAVAATNVDIPVNEWQLCFSTLRRSVGAGASTLKASQDVCMACWAVARADKRELAPDMVKKGKLLLMP